MYIRCISILSLYQVKFQRIDTLSLFNIAFTRSLYVFYINNNLSNRITSLTKRYFIQSVLLLDENCCHASKPIVRSQAVAIANGTFVCDSIKLQTDASFDSKKK